MKHSHSSDTSFNERRGIAIFLYYTSTFFKPFLLFFERIKNPCCGIKQQQGLIVESIE